MTFLVDLVTGQSVYFCRFRVLLFTLLGFGPPSSSHFFWRSQVTPSGSFYFLGGLILNQLGWLCEHFLMSPTLSVSAMPSSVKVPAYLFRSNFFLCHSLLPSNCRSFYFLIFFYFGSI